MKQTTAKWLTIAIYALAIICGASLLATGIAHSGTTATYAAPEQPALDSEQQAWLGALEWCESGGNPAAINPKDSDGTPSYGLLQFKPGTYAEFATLYGIGSTTDYMDGAEQAAIVTQMILRGGVDWHHQFPGCTAKIGVPPLSPTRSQT